MLAFSAFALAAPAVQAQDNTALVPDLIEAWVEEQVPEYTDAVKDYGAGCLIPVIASLPEDALATIVAAGAMEPGLTALDESDPETMAALVPSLQRCIETVLLGGESISPWVDDEWGDAPDEEKADVTSCFLAAVEPLDSDAKGLIFEAEDFESGAEALLEQLPDLAGFEDALEACD